MHIEAIQYHDANISTLILPVKRYTLEGNNSSGLVLFFAHGTGMHKEQWEPIIEKLLQLKGVSAAYSFDWPNHGEGAVLNADVLASFEPVGVATWDWGRLIAGFYKANNFDRRRTVGIAHSGGCTGLLHSTIPFPLDSQPYACMILFETAMISRAVYTGNLEWMEKALTVLKKNILKRRETWANKAEALTWLSGKLPWRTWDRRVLALFVDHALGELPGDNSGQVRLLCTREQEVTAYRNVETHYQAMDHYGRLDTPVHFVFGEHVTMVPKFQQDSNIDPVNTGRAPTSVRRVPNATHLVIQERPDECAQVIAELLEEYLPNHKARL